MATLTVNELAIDLGTSPREARKFLRDITPVEEQPGKGHRWQIEKRAVRGLKKQFAERQTAKEVPADVNDDAAETVDA